MYSVHYIDSLSEVSASEWNAVTGIDYPFTRHEFLWALEASGATVRDSGWQPHHMLVYRESLLVAVMPLYVKYHSYGEYVFDWAWADAWRRHGRAYYPKLLSAIPYTPATGPRLCLRDGEDRESLCRFALASLIEEARALGVSSAHILFPDSGVSEMLAERGFAARIGAQYHWFNRGYRDFEDFLSTCASRKRKNLRRERRKVVEQGLQLRVLVGREIGERLWQLFFHCYQLTYAKRSGHGGYLSADFFRRVAQLMPEQVVMVVAERDGEFVAAALNFRSGDCLYGRYWGCLREVEYLHFEACYYQGIDYCIREGLSRFDPGAQGEHKIQRGFTPVAIYSNHWIQDADFRAAIDNALSMEAEDVRLYLAQAATLLPFKR